jgi:hypothetical protein
MSNRIRTMAAVVLLVSLAVGRADALVTIPGSWSIESGRAPAQVKFTVHTDSDRAGFHDTSSFDFDPSALRLLEALPSTSERDVTFTIVREAGSFACSGSFVRGAGGGSFIFTPNAEFLAQMRDRGYGQLEPRDLLAAATVDLTTKFVDDISAEGYRHLPLDKLFAFRALGVDGAFVRSMRSTFRTSAIDAAEMISLRALGISDAYIREMREAGFAVAAPNDAVQLRALNVNAAYVRDLASAGYSHLSSQELVQLRALGIDAAYIKRVEAHGFSHLPIDQLIRLKALNVVATRFGRHFA